MNEHLLIHSCESSENICLKVVATNWDLPKGLAAISGGKNFLIIVNIGVESR